MSDRWIKMRMDLDENVKVIAMSQHLRISTDAILGKLFRLWCWVARNAPTGSVTHAISTGWIDAYTAQSGFAESLIAVGWLRITGTKMEFPNFAEHNWEVKTPKQLAAERARRYRERRHVTQRDGGVTMSRDASRTPIPIPKEEKKNTPLPPKGETSFTLPQALDTPEFRVLWEEWERHRREIRHALKDTTRKKQLRELERMGLARAAAALEYSIRQGYQGIVEEKGKANGTPYGAVGRPGRVESPQGKYDHLDGGGKTPPVAGAGARLPEAQGASSRSDRTGTASGDPSGGPG